MIDDVIDFKDVIAESDRFVLLWDGRDEGESLDDAPLICINKFTSEAVSWHRIVDEYTLRHAKTMMINAELMGWWL